MKLTFDATKDMYGFADNPKRTRRGLSRTFTRTDGIRSVPNLPQVWAKWDCCAGNETLSSCESPVVLTSVCTAVSIPLEPPSNDGAAIQVAAIDQSDQSPGLKGGEPSARALVNSGSCQMFPLLNRKPLTLFLIGVPQLTAHAVLPRLSAY